MIVFKVIGYLCILLPLSFAQLMVEAWWRGVMRVCSSIKGVVMNRKVGLLLLSFGLWTSMCIHPIVTVLMVVSTILTAQAVAVAQEDGWVMGGAM